MKSRKATKNILLLFGNLFYKAGQVKDIPEHPKKMLVFTRKAIGDVVMATPAFRALRKRYPDTHLTLCTMEWNRGVVEQSPFFDEILLLDNSVAMNRNIFGIMKFIVQTGKQRYDIAVLFDSFMFPLYCALARIPVRVGPEFDDEGFALTHKIKVRETDHRLQQFLDIVQLIGCKADDPGLDFPVILQPEELRRVDAVLEALPDSRYLIGIVAGGGRNPGQIVEAKNWPAEKYSRVIGKLLENYRVNVLLFGKDEDAVIAADIIDKVRTEQPARFERVIDLCDKTSIRQAAALLKKCHLVLTNDTSLMHLAAAVGTPTVAIFGPTDPANLAARGPAHQVVRSALACSPCYARQGYLLCRSECMESITWNQVYEKVAAVLNAGPSVANE